MMTIGERIRDRRCSLGISQVALADKVGISKQSLYKYENGIITNIPSDKIEEIAAALSTSPAYLMGWDSAAAVSRATDPLLPLSREEESIIRNYRASDESTQLAVCAVLGVKKDVGLSGSARNEVG